MTPHKHRDVIIAWANGARIEYRNFDSNVWQEISNPNWMAYIEYRIKQEPKLVPFDADDAKKIVGKIVKNTSIEPTFSIITTANSNEVIIGSTPFNYDTLFKYFTFSDGSPCGKIQ